MTSGTSNGNGEGVPKGNPGKVKPKQREKALSNTSLVIEREVAAIKFPMLMRALNNLPPTRAEIEMVRLFGYPGGITDPGRVDRWVKTRDRKYYGDSPEESG